MLKKYLESKEQEVVDIMMTLFGEIAECVPALSLDELKLLEAEVMQLA